MPSPAARAPRRAARWLLLALLAALPSGAGAQVVRSAAGNAAAITPARDQFRLDLGGGVVGGPNGSFGGLRREINWDGVPDGFSAPNNLPPNFFNVNSARGVVFATPGTGFQVSANAVNPTATPIEFGNLNATYPSAFGVFSSEKLFTALGSNVLDVDFFVPGSTTPALTRGFGAVFTTVDLANTTSIQFFDVNGVSLGTFFAPTLGAAANFPESLSFLGVSYATPTISRVRITSGNAAVGPNDFNGNPIDVVVMDDFIYGEPQAIVPEPATWALLGTGLLGVLAGARRRRRA